MKPRRLIAVLVAPLALATAAASGPADPIATVPFEFVRNSIVVTVKVADKGPFTMLIDTGVSPSAIDLGLAKTLHLALSNEAGQATGGGSEAMPVYDTKLPVVALGALTSAKIRAVAVDLKEPSKALGRSLYGMLGQSFLEQYVVQIDYPKHLIRFFENTPIASNEPSPRRASLPMHALNGDLLVEGAEVNGQWVAANLDTGCSGRFMIAPSLAAKLRLVGTGQSEALSQSVGINGIMESEEVAAESLHIGGLAVGHPRVALYPKDSGLDEVQWGLRIGNAFLRDYVVTIDYKSGILTLEQP